MENTRNNQRGITLIALVVTIIILLILAGISIAMLTGQNVILNRAQEAKEKTETSQKDENEKLQGYESTIEQYTGKIPEGLQVGETVKYSPSGTYNWQAKYCSATLTEDVTLSSKSGEAFNLTEWKVLSIENGKVELIPTKPTEGTVYLGQAQGYNNGVKLLNDACSSLYSSKGVTARSLNIDDIEKYMEKEKLEEVHQYQNNNGNGVKYGTQLESAYTTNKNYPLIYANENLSVINGNEKTNGLGRSEQTTFVEKDDGGATNGKMSATTSIQPYQTYWYKDNSYIQGAFKTATSGTNYYELLIRTSGNYWLASRCIDNNVDNCNFNIRHVNNGNIGSYNMYYSIEHEGNYGRQSIFPVVSLNASLISKDETNGFTINVE